MTPYFDDGSGRVVYMGDCLDVLRKDVADTTAIVGIRGSGKTNTAVVSRPEPTHR